MNSNYVWGTVLVVLVIGAAVWYWSERQMQQQNDLGTYAYECDEHVAFAMTPAADMSTIRVKPTIGLYPPDTVLHHIGEGAYYEGDGVILRGNGESIVLGEGDSAINCSPVVSPDQAPFNWGDQLESMNPDIFQAVAQNLIGTWISTEDSKFTREFTEYAAIDSYDGKDTSSSPWQLFTKEEPLEVSFPLEDGTVYIQIQDEQPLNFKIVKLTPDELELVYMDRGNMLRFTRMR